MQINPHLIARLYAVRAAYNEIDPQFYQQNFQQPQAQPAAAKHWRDVLKDEDGEGEGGGGTMKGLRGKDAEYAKQAMRKLTRAGR